MPADAAQWGSVEELARRAVERFGRVDVWVNNAVLAAVGRLEEVPPEANLLGYVHGARAALPLFRGQGSGALVDMSSGFGLVGAPYAGAYAATKFAQRGLAQALRGELRGSGVRVCAIMPGGVDTPAYRLAANYSGRAAGPKGFLASPEKIARVVVRCAERPRPEVVVGNPVGMLRLAHALAPRVVERAAARTIERGFLRQEAAEPSPGNLHEPSPQWAATDGGLNRQAGRRAAHEPRRAAAAGASVFGPGILTWLLLREGRSRRRDQP